MSEDTVNLKAHLFCKVTFSVMVACPSASFSKVDSDTSLQSLPPNEEIHFKFIVGIKTL
jgi:hypothetical protein